MTKISRALVTGGAGFIGSHVVDELVARGIETIVLDNLTTGSLANLARHEGSEMVHVVKGDISDAGRILEGIGEIDVVFHEAAIASVKKSVEDPMLVHAVNVDGTLSVMNFCVRKRVRRFVFASSAAVYGGLRDVPASEEQLCLPASPYGSSKLAVECYLASYYRTYGLETVGLRYFNVYGPRQRLNDYSGVITVFANALARHDAPVIFGDGGQSRDFVFVKDIARANMIAMTSEKAPGEVFNVASGTSTRILDLLGVLKDLFGWPGVEPRFAPPRVGDVRYGRASVAKIQNVLGYCPDTPLGEGLSQFIDGMRGPREVLPV
ncbi:MAG: NAD-dependent epimerase/dehydratase family protein [Thaumarchaeota archaeon]|nr:NAD-dependent epimerase/dehydratase family protein [Nitrososphaerota archaeon]